MQNDLRFFDSNKNRLLNFLWSTHSLNDLIIKNAPCRIFYRAEENYPLIIFQVNKKGEIPKQTNLNIVEVLNKLKSLLYRGSRADILIEKKIKTMGWIYDEDLKISIVKPIIKSQFKAFEARIMTEDYLTKRDEIILRAKINERDEKHLKNLIKEIQVYYPINRS